MIIDIPTKNLEGLVSHDPLEREQSCNLVSSHIQSLTYNYMLREYQKPINDNIFDMQSQDIQESLEHSRRLSDQPEYVQIAEVNRLAMLNEIPEHERLRRIFAIRARFSNDVNAIQEIR